MGFAASAVVLVPARAIRIHREGNPARERPGKKTGRGLPLPFRSFPDILISCRIRRFYTWMFLLDSSFRYLNASLGCASSRMVPSSSERGGGLDKTLKRRAHFFHHASTGEPMTRKVIILGSGCAGSTAAIYTARANLSPLVLEGHEPGGQLSLTTDVENYPGFPDGIQGPELVDLMKRQAQRFGAEYRMEKVTGVDLAKRPFTVNTDENSYEAQSLIIATGASARMLGLESEKKLLGRGGSRGGTCDAGRRLLRRRRRPRLRLPPGGDRGRLRMPRRHRRGAVARIPGGRVTGGKSPAQPEAAGREGWPFPV